MYRLQVTVSDKMVDKIDAYASEIGVSRAATCAFLMQLSLERIMGNTFDWQMPIEHLRKDSGTYGKDTKLEQT